MPSKKMPRPYAIALGITVLYGIGSILYCVLFGQSMMGSHIYPHYAWRTVQMAAAVVLSLILFGLKTTRKKLHWQIIPALLLGLAPVYVLIVDQFPCCMGG